MEYRSLTVGAIALLVIQPRITFAADAPSTAKLLEKARQVHSKVLTFDSHFDLPFDYAGAAADGKTQFDLPKAARGQLKGAAIAIFVPQGPRTPEAYSKARADADKKYQLIKAIADGNPDKASIAYTPDDV